MPKVGGTAQFKHFIPRSPGFGSQHPEFYYLNCCLLVDSVHQLNPKNIIQKLLSIFHSTLIFALNISLLPTFQVRRCQEQALVYPIVQVVASTQLKVCRSSCIGLLLFLLLLLFSIEKSVASRRILHRQSISIIR